MIVHVWRRACEAAIGPVVVATDSHEVADVISTAGGASIMTRCDHQSGSDRIFEALEIADPQADYDVVVNLQGDVPTIDPGSIMKVIGPLTDPLVDVASLACTIESASERDDPNVVKIIASEVAPGRLRALYFTRATAPWGDGPLYHHIGVYAYRREALRRFVTLPESGLERRERLEQLRALEAGMRIDISIVDDLPWGVDTVDSLERAREEMSRRPY